MLLLAQLKSCLAIIARQCFRMVSALIFRMRLGTAKNSVNCQKTGIRSNQANAGLNIATNNKAILINNLKNAVA